MKKLLMVLLVLSVLMSGTTIIVKAETETVSLPSELLSDNPSNPSKALEGFLKTCSNKKVLFPSNKTYVLERQLVIYGVSNLEIDFNGCTLKLPDNLSWKTRYDTGSYVTTNAITVHSSNNVKFSNYIIDGNSANISELVWCTGLWISNTNGFTSNNGYFKRCNYHHIVIYPGTKNIKFTRTFFKDHGGSTGGISDVYVSNGKDDDYSFIDTTVDNTSLKERQGQCFYIWGYNGYIDRVTTKNCSIPLDIRKGQLVANNFTINNAEQVLMVQPNPEKSTEFADITASNFTGTNILGNKYGAASVYIVGCVKCKIDNFNIQMDSRSRYSWYGIRVRKYYSNYPVNDVTISNTEISNCVLAGIITEDLSSSINANTIKVTGASSSSYGFKSTSCTSTQFVKNLSVVNCRLINSSDNMVQIN